ncbi:unnamed protein product [Ilex paraguariensis]|uniref:WRKY domain-containing protein n=1 Tax=Ilex paraguariensis TaxID=185542 RepID=A0ABC8T5R9_9AQUA
MEVKEAERIVIAKPVASKPTCSGYRTFSELLAGAISASPSNVCTGAAVTPIRPKTVRFKPMANIPSVGVISSQDLKSGAAVVDSFDNVLKSESKSTVVYKPLAKLLSKTPVSLLANSVSNISHQQGLFQAGSCPQLSYQVKHHLESDLGSNLHKDFPSQSETEKIMEPSNMTPENLEEDPRTSQPIANGDRPSYDGYSWRKYGQKQVKGSEYPRSYYKCTHTSCPVKKKVERSFDGQITETVYKGEHNHSKPQPPKRNTSGGQGQGFVSDGTVQYTNSQLWSNQINGRNECSEGRIENQSEVGLSVNSTSPGKALLSDPATSGKFKADVPTPDNPCGLSGNCDEERKGVEAEDDERKSKRRKNENQSHETGISQQSAQEPCFVVQNSTDCEIVGDGFRWRKYGQKVVKGNQYPRSYYRCTSLKCNVRKHVERASDDPTAFITTYEGKHNHDMPIKSTTPMASEPASKPKS